MPRTRRDFPDSYLRIIAAELRRESIMNVLIAVCFIDFLDAHPSIREPRPKSAIADASCVRACVRVPTSTFRSRNYGKHVPHVYLSSISRIAGTYRNNCGLLDFASSDRRFDDPDRGTTVIPRRVKL